MQKCGKILVAKAKIPDNILKGKYLLRGFIKLLNSLRFNTTFRLHHKMTKYAWYKKWHDFRYSHYLHVATLLGYTLGLLLFCGLNLFVNPKNVLAAPSSSSKTSFSGAGDGAYGNTLPINGGADVAIDGTNLSNANGGSWKYKRPISITNTSGGTLTDNLVQVSPFNDSAFLNNSGLIGSYHLNGGTSGGIANGTTNGFEDSSGLNAGGTASNVNAGGLAWTAGKFSGAATFDGVDDYINIGTVAGQQVSTGSVTVESWVKTTAATGDIFTRAGANSPWSGYSVNIGGNSNNGKLCFWYGNNANWDCSVNTVNDGNWHHLAITFNSINTYFYIDGVLNATVAKTGTVSLSSSAAAYIGAESSSGTLVRFFNGQIDEVKIYNRLLSASEISARYGTSGVSKIRGDYQDIRFVKSDGTELPYYQENDGKYWLKYIGNLTTSGDTIYMYYGNPQGSYNAATAETSTFKQPNTISGVKAWYKPSSLNSVDGTPISTFTDFSGNSKDATQVTSTSQPLLKANVFNGKPAARFDGTDDWLSATNIAAGYTPEVYAVGRIITYSAQGIMISAPENGYTMGTYAAGSGNVGTSITTGALKASRSLALSSPAVIRNYYGRNLGANVAQFAVNGSVVNYTLAAADYAAVNLSNLDIGRFAAPGHYQNFDLAELLVFSGPLSVSDRQALELYMGAKYGFTVTPATAQPTSAAPGSEASITTNSGTYTTTVIAPAGLYGNWGILTFSSNTTAGQSVTAEILKASDGTTVPGKTGLATNTNLNISTQDYPSIKIKFTLTSDGVTSPSLGDYSLAYDYDVVAAPLNQIINNTTASSAHLSWTNGSLATMTYTVQRSIDYVTWTSAGGTCAGVVSGISCDDSGLASNTKYYWRVRGTDLNGNISGWSGELVKDSNSVGLWHLNEGTGASVTDSSGNGITGTLTVGATGTQTTSTQAWTNGTNGRFDKAINFDGTDDYVNIGTSASIQLNTALSVEAWVKTTKSSEWVIGRWSDVDAAKQAYLIYINASGKPGAMLDNGSTINDLIVTGTTTVNNGAWHHLAFTWDRAAGINNFKIYVDGNLEGQNTSANASLATIPTVPLVLGGLPGQSPGTFYSGLADEVRISNIARTAAEIQNSQLKSTTTLTDKAIVTSFPVTTNNNKPIISGTSASGANLKLFSGSTELASTTASGVNFTFSSISYSAALSEGVNTLVVKSYNSANVPNDSDSFVINLDTVTPTTSYSIARPSAAVVELNGYMTTEPLITLTAVDPAPSSGVVAYYKWDDPSFTSPSTYSIPFAMSQGTHVLYWKTVDAAGNQEVLKSQELKLDSFAPSSISIDIVDNYLNKESLGISNIALSAIDDNSGVGAVSFSSGADIYCGYEDYSSSVSFDFSATSRNGMPACLNFSTTDGSRTLYAKFRDNAGNLSSVVNDSVIRDITLPENPSATVSTNIGNKFNDWYADLTPDFTITQNTLDVTSGIKGYYVYFGTDVNATPEVDGAFQIETTFSSTIDLADSGKTFYLRIQSEDNAGNIFSDSDVSKYTLFTYKIDATSPAAVSYITPTPAGWSATNNFSFVWPSASDISINSDSSDIKGYQYRRRTIAEQDVWESWDNSKFVAQAGNKISLSNIEALYTGVNILQVKVVDNVGNESPVISASFYYSGDIPKPTNLQVDLSQSANQTANRYSFSWDKPTGVDTQGYYYSVNAAPDTQNSTYIPTAATQVSTGFSAFATKTGLNTFYVVTKANDNVGWTNFEKVEFTCNTSAPGIPTNVMITDSSNRDSQRWQLTVNWDQPAEVTSDFNGYVVERSTDGDNFSEIATTSKETTGYLDTGLLNSVTYSYRIKAKDNTGNKSAVSTVATRQPTGRYTEAPNLVQDPEVEPQATKAKISFVTDRDADSFVQIGTSDKYGMTQGQLDSTSIHEVMLSGLTPGTFYHYRAMWRDIDSNIGYSKDFTFKTQEAPGISEVTVSNISLYSAIVSWKTTTVSSSTVYFGKTNTYGSQVEDRSGSGTTTHVVKINDLTDSTTYHFKISGSDVDGNPLVSDDYSFETLTFPRTSGLKITQKVDEAMSTIVVTWTSNVPTDSVVNYSGQESSKAQLETRHSIVIGNLKDNTSYSISVGGRDSYGNQAEASTITYKTPFDSRPPVISNITTETSITGYGKDAKTQVIVSWETDEPSTSQVIYGVGVGGADYSQKTQEDSALTTSHIVVISGLKASTSYHFEVSSKDQSTNNSFSEDNSFLTDQANVSVLDVVINSLQSTLGWIFGSISLQK